MKQNGKKYKLCIVVICLLSVSCKQYFFMPRGTTVMGDQAAYYYNDSLKLAIKIPGDFNIYNKKKKHGTKINSIYSSDRMILKFLGLNSGSGSLLFSTIPTSTPDYNFIAFIADNLTTPYLSEFKTKVVNDTLLYYYKSQILKKKEVFQTIIPVNDKYLSFVYYNDINTTCHFCDIENLSLKNAYRIARKQSTDLPELQDTCASKSMNSKLQVVIPDQVALKEKAALIYVYKIDKINQSKTLKSFKVLRPNEKNFYVNICNGEYLIHYLDLNHKLKWSVSKQTN